jgi:transmembrane protein EpsG
MTIYIIIYLIIAILAILDFFSGKEFRIKLNGFIGLLIFLILGIFAGSRYKIGGSDYDAYEAYYNLTPNKFSKVYTNDYDSFLESTEKGYIFLMTFFKQINLNFNIFLIIIGGICAIAIYFSFKRYTTYLFVTTLIFLSKGYLYYFFTAQRQIIAMAICWFSIKYIIEEKLYKFILLVIVASLFHSSALFFIIIYFSNKINLTNKKIFAIMAMSLVVGLFNIGPLLSIVISNFLPIGGDKLLVYLEGESSSVNILNYFELVPLLLIVTLNKDRISMKTRYFNILLNMFILYIALTIAFYNFSFIARLKGYFIIGYVAIFASIITIPNNKVKGFGLLILILVYCLMVFIRELITFNGGIGYLPYSSYFFQ